MGLEPVTKILHKPMDRKYFLQTIGLMVLTVVGLHAFVQFMSKKEHNNSTIGRYGD